jgi:single-strand DNA-binding protein
MNDSLITFSGWVGSEVELVRVGEGEGVPVATFRVGSTPRRLREGRWENGETVWYAVKAWRSLATHVAASLHTGEPVLVTGRLVAETWQKEDGTQVTRHVVVAQGVGHDLARGTSAFTRAGAIPTASAVSAGAGEDASPGPVASTDPVSSAA